MEDKLLEAIPFSKELEELLNFYKDYLTEQTVGCRLHYTTLWYQIQSLHPTINEEKYTYRIQLAFNLDHDMDFVHKFLEETDNLFEKYIELRKKKCLSVTADGNQRSIFILLVEIGAIDIDETKCDIIKLR